MRPKSRLPSLPTASRRGFTLIELLIILALLSIVVTIGYPALQNMLERSKIEGITREVSTLMIIGRTEAIKRRVPVIVRIDQTERVVEGFLDVDLDGDFGAGDELLRRHVLPTTVDFGGPVADPAEVDGFTVAPGGLPNQAVFRRNGTVDDDGAFRFVDARNNFLEVRVEPRATARPRVRKWDGSDWWARGENGVPWTWE